MPLNWKIFRLACYVHVIAASLLCLASLIGFFLHFSVGAVLSMIAFLLMAAFGALGIRILGSNYPDTPVAGSQKSSFNWLYLTNFLILIILFALLFSEWNSLVDVSRLMHTQPLSVPFRFMWGLIIDASMLILQFILLYGLFVLRRELHANWMQKKFEFEER